MFGRNNRIVPETKVDEESAIVKANTQKYIVELGCQSLKRIIETLERMEISWDWKDFSLNDATGLKSTNNKLKDVTKKGLSGQWIAYVTLSKFDKKTFDDIISTVKQGMEQGQNK